MPTESKIVFLISLKLTFLPFDNAIVSDRIIISVYAPERILKDINYRKDLSYEYIHYDKQ